MNLRQLIGFSGGKELLQVTHLWIDARASAVSLVIIRTLIPCDKQTRKFPSMIRGYDYIRARVRKSRYQVSVVTKLWSSVPDSARVRTKDYVNRCRIATPKEVPFSLKLLTK